MRLLYEDLELYYTVHKDKYVDNNSEYAFSYVDSWGITYRVSIEKE